MRNRTWQLAAVFIVVLLIIGGVAWVNTQPRQTGEFVPGIGGGPPVTPPEEERLISDIAQNPTQYAGQTVTLRGEVDRIFDPQIFVLDQMGTAVGDEVLVITTNPIPIPPEAGRDVSVPLQNTDQVTVSGTVRLFIIENIEQEIGLDLDQALEVEFEGKPVIMATDVSVVTPTPSN